MKLYKFIAISVLSIISNYSFAQTTTVVDDIKVVYINKDVTVHFRSPEPINYIDISTNNLIGDIPIDNIAKVKCVADSTFKEGNVLAVVSIAGDSYLAQYKIVYSESESHQATDIEIDQYDMHSLQFPSITLTRYEMRQFALKMQERPRKFRKVQSKAMGLKAHINNIYAYGDYIFIDVTYENVTKIKYDIALFDFKIEDRKIYKATNSQSIEIKPVFVLYDNPHFQNTYRNIFAFDKFTFPNDKIFKIRLIEKEISGRTLELAIEYRDLLNADTF